YPNPHDAIGNLLRRDGHIYGGISSIAIFRLQLRTRFENFGDANIRAGVLPQNVSQGVLVKQSVPGDLVRVNRKFCGSIGVGGRRRAVTHSPNHNLWSCRLEDAQTYDAIGNMFWGQGNTYVGISLPAIFGLQL